LSLHVAGRAPLFVLIGVIDAQKLSLAETAR
jgi:hypothetical protein